MIKSVFASLISIYKILRNLTNNMHYINVNLHGVIDLKPEIHSFINVREEMGDLLPEKQNTYLCLW